MYLIFDIFVIVDVCLAFPSHPRAPFPVPPFAVRRVHLRR